MVHRRRNVGGLFLSLLCALAASPAAGAVPSLVADLNRTPAFFRDFFAHELSPLGDKLLFVATGAVEGQELWISDGTAPGTHLLLDLSPNEFGSFIQIWGATTRRAFFSVLGPSSAHQLWATDGTTRGTLQLTSLAGGLGDPNFVHTAVDRDGERFFFTVARFQEDRELWVTDGSAAGTRRVLDIRPGPLSSDPQNLRLAGGRLFFVADDGVHGPELWVTDGTSAGTRMVADLTAGGGHGVAIAPLVAFGDRVLFWREDVATGLEPWVSDGTAGGTRLLRDIAPGPLPSTSNAELVVTRHGGFFVAGDRITRTELWRTDGTPEGTVRLTSMPRVEPFPLQDLSRYIFEAGGVTYFYADDGVHGRELWTTDGTPDGTRLLADLCPGECFFVLSLMSHVSERAFFSADDGVHGYELWTTDGTAAGTRMLADLCPGECNSIPLVSPPVGGRFPVIAVDGPSFGQSLWRTDGTPAGTRRLTTLSTLDLYRAFHWPTPIGDQLFFVAEIGFQGLDLWKSDLTVAGTGRVRAPDPPREAGSNPDVLTPFGNGILFFADDGVAGVELWRSDGTAAATRRLSEVDGKIRPVLAGSAGRRFFVVQEDPQARLWVTDGTPAGTVPLAPAWFDSGVAALGEVVLFQGDDSLWVSDGTAAGTRLLATRFATPDLQPGAFAVLGGALYYRSTWGGLWRTDGTVDGTSEVFQHAEPYRLSPDELTHLGGRLFFSGSHPGENPTLWVSDGTPGGTREVTAGLAAEARPFYPQGLRAAGGRLFFRASDAAGQELWVSDGTAGGTRRVADLLPGPGSSLPVELTALGGRVVFVADDGVSGEELWVSDGTAAGTARVRDLFPGLGSSYPRNLVVIDGTLYFQASDGVGGYELWRSDGTAAGTARVADLAPGPYSTYPGPVVAAGGRLLFAASDPARGRELWALPLAGDAERCMPGEGRLCLLDGRIAVTVRWRNKGQEGAGTPVPFSDRTGQFWFFNPGKIELLVKVLDGGNINGHYWSFYGALSNVEYWVEVTEVATGRSRVYHNPPKRICGVGDVRSLPIEAAGAAPPADASRAAGALPPQADEATAPRGACAPGATTLCLLGGRFAVEVDWHNQRNGQRGSGHAVPGTDESGAFWFFAADNLELATKVVDGRPVNGYFWVFYGGLSDVEYTLRVTDTASGEERVYRNPPGEICGDADITAFPLP